MAQIRDQMYQQAKVLHAHQERLSEQCAKLDYQGELFEKTSQAIDKNHEDHEEYTQIIADLHAKNEKNHDDHSNYSKIIEELSQQNKAINNDHFEFTTLIKELREQNERQTKMIEK